MAKRNKPEPIRTELPFLGHTTNGRITRLRNVEDKVLRKGHGGYIIGTSGSNMTAG